jgi:hypothetical protein
LLRVNKELYNIASPYLYSRVVLTTDNAAGLFEGLEMKPTPAAGPYGRGKLRRREKFVGSAPPWVRSGPRVISLWKRKTKVVYEARWPEDSADSDEGEDEERKEDPDEASQSGSGGSGNNQVGDQTESKAAYPNKASHERKLQLLGYVKHLTIASVPVTRFSMRIVSTFLHLRDTPPEVERIATLFKICTHLRLSSRAIWYLAEWSNRHRSRSHPFARALLDIVKPRHLCLTHATISPQRRDAWLDARVDRERSVPAPDELDDVKSRWWTFCQRYNQVALSKLVQMWELDSMDVHGAVDAYVPPSSRGIVRVRYKACPCSASACKELEVELQAARDKRKSASAMEAMDSIDADEEKEAPRRDTGKGTADTSDVASISSETTNPESELDDDITPETCDQHIVLVGRSQGISRMIGGQGSLLKREHGESVDGVTKWELIDAWQFHETGAWGTEQRQAAASVETGDTGQTGGSGALGQAEGKVGDRPVTEEKIIRQVDEWMGALRLALEAQVEQGALGKDMVDKVELMYGAEADCCTVCESR